MRKNYLKAVFSMLIFGTIGIFRRYIPLPSGLLALSRGLLGGLFLLILLKVQKKDVKAGKHNLILLAVTGALIGFNWILLFESYNYTTVQVATLSYYMAPTFVLLMSPIFLGEKVTPKKLLCALCSVMGMVLVSGVADGGALFADDVTGIIYGLGAAILYATVIILNKKIRGVDAVYKTMLQLFSASITIVPYILLREDVRSVEITAISALMLVVVGVFHTGFAYSLYFGSMENLSAQSVACLSYIDPVFALILSGVVLHESLSLWGLIGAIMIIVSSVCGEINLQILK